MLKIIKEAFSEWPLIYILAEHKNKEVHTQLLFITLH